MQAKKATEEPDMRESNCETPVYNPESKDLFAEDVEQHLAVLPEVDMHTEDITFDDI